MNHIVDRAGEYANVNQPTKDAWFLAGKSGDETNDLPFLIFDSKNIGESRSKQWDIRA